MNFTLFNPGQNRMRAYFINSSLILGALSCLSFLQLAGADSLPAQSLQRACTIQAIDSERLKYYQHLESKPWGAAATYWIARFEKSKNDFFKKYDITQEKIDKALTSMRFVSPAESSSAIDKNDSDWKRVAAYISLDLGVDVSLLHILFNSPKNEHWNNTIALTMGTVRFSISPWTIKTEADRLSLSRWTIAHEVVHFLHYDHIFVNLMPSEIGRSEYSKFIESRADILALLNDSSECGAFFSSFRKGCSSGEGTHPSDGERLSIGLNLSDQMRVAEEENKRAFTLSEKQSKMLQLIKLECANYYKKLIEKPRGEVAQYWIHRFQRQEQRLFRKIGINRQSLEAAQQKMVFLTTYPDLESLFCNVYDIDVVKRRDVEKYIAEKLGVDASLLHILFSRKKDIQHDGNCISLMEYTTKYGILKEGAIACVVMHFLHLDGALDHLSLNKKNKRLYDKFLKKRAEVLGMLSDKLTAQYHKERFDPALGSPTDPLFKSASEMSSADRRRYALLSKVYGQMIYVPYPI